MSSTTVLPQMDGREIPWSFLYLLRESRLLSEDQKVELERRLDGLDMPALTAFLSEQGWLTPYQLQRILAGEGRGLLLGQYRLLSELGEGGFGKVYKAIHALMNRLAAVKVIAPKWARRPLGRDLFLREVSAVTRLVHPNIVLAYEADQTDDALWFAMEYVDGPTLEGFVSKWGPLPVPFACAVMAQVGRALQFAHENGMVHRDVKPANLLLPGAGSIEDPASFRPAPGAVLVKVVDFGLAKLFPVGTPHAPSICQDGMCVGTPEYMSPEQARNSHKVDIRSDLYSLGCAFYYALAGRPPFPGATEVETISRHLEDEAQPLRDLRPDVPPAVANVVHRLLAKKPTQRYATPADFLECLQFALRNASRAALPDAPGLPSPPPPALTSADSRTDVASVYGLSATRVLEPASTIENPARGREQVNPATDSVATLWREWLGVVEALARGKSCEWTEAEYAALYRALLEDARLIAASSSRPQAPLYARLETLVEPWVKWRALAALDEKTRSALAETCRRLDAELRPPRRTLFGPWWPVLALILGIAVLVGTLLLSAAK